VRETKNSWARGSFFLREAVNCREKCCRTTNLAPFSDEEVRFSWTTPPSLSEVLPGMLYARVYSMAPVQLPADFDALDCARSRFVAQLALG